MMPIRTVFFIVADRSRETFIGIMDWFVKQHLSLFICIERLCNTPQLPTIAVIRPERLVSACFWMKALLSG